MSTDFSAIEQAKASIMLRTAEGIWLTRLGRRYGVSRPPNDPNNDSLYRQVIGLLAWLPKSIFFSVYKLAEIIFGSQASLIRPWRIYEVNANEIIFECPIALIGGSNENASYFHGFYAWGYATAVDTITLPGDITEAATSVVGKILYIHDADPWTAHTILTAVYNSGTGVSTVTFSTAVVANADYQAYLDIADASSYAGDYMAPDANEPADGVTPATVEHDRRVYLYGQGALDTFEFYMLTIVKAAGVALRIEQI